MPTPNKIVHKLIVPGPRAGMLHELILCWRMMPGSQVQKLAGILFSRNINTVTCPECQKMWDNGIYS